MKKKKHAFTMAEIMVVLGVIGVLTAVLLPVAFNSAPDEEVMKFKKGNKVLTDVIRELVNSTLAPTNEYEEPAGRYYKGVFWILFIFGILKTGENELFIIT